MRAKQPRLVVSFHTTASAMAAERLCKRLDLPGRLIPVPRSITSDCGIAWSAPPELQAVLEAQFSAAGIETEGFYRLLM